MVCIGKHSLRLAKLVDNLIVHEGDEAKAARPLRLAIILQQHLLNLYHITSKCNARARARVCARWLIIAHVHVVVCACLWSYVGLQERDKPPPRC